MRRILFCLLFLALPHLSFSQDDSIRVSDELNFLFHLGEQKQIDNLELYSEQILNDTINFSEGLRDSAAFISAQFFKDFKNTVKARAYNDQISFNSIFKFPASYSSGLMEMDEHKYDLAYQKIYDSPEAESGILYELRIFELAGMSLLQGDHSNFELVTATFLPQDSTLQAETQFLYQYNQLLQNMKPKSAFVAGALSAIIPGLGKLYTGLPGQALTSFLKVVPLGIITAENYRNGGFKNAQFFIFGSLFSLFYIGGIWGSSISAKIVYQEKVDEIHHNIMVGLHVPVDRIFH